MSTLAPVSASSLPPPSTVARAVVSELSAALAGRVSFNDEDRLFYSRDMWPKAILWIQQGLIPPPPDLVVWPESEEEVCKVIALARSHRLAVIPFGAGSGVCGGICAIRGGIALDLKRLEQVGPVDADDLSVEAQAGVIGEVLERRLNAQGYTLGHFPSSIYMSTLGGWLAARSAGQLSNKYGKIEDMTLSVRAVTGTGEVLQTGRRPLRGPDLSQLLLGSEGALCAFTSARLRVHRVPARRSFRGVVFKSFSTGMEAIRKIFSEGIRPSVVRLYDPLDTAIVGKGHVGGKPDVPPSLRSKLRGHLLPSLVRQLAPKAVVHPSLLNRGAQAFSKSQLILVFEGSKERVEAEERAALAICAAHSGADQGEEPGRAWYAKRYDVSYQMSKVLDAGMFADTMEVAGTWDKVWGIYQAVRQGVEGLAFVLCHLSHVYPEGCSLYFSFAGAPGDATDPQSRYDELWRRALLAATGAGATVSHHHGIGLLKARELKEELAEGWELLKALKKTFDPDGIMNPGKLGL